MTKKRTNQVGELYCDERPFGVKRCYNLRTSRKETVPVTVCVAAICDHNTVIGASDRMITAGDVQFEPPQTKVAMMTSSIGIMTSGDTTINSQILQSVHMEMIELLEADPDYEWTVKEVAELYAHFYNEIRERGAEKAYLTPIGLTMESFISRQKEMSPDFVTRVGTEMMNYSPGDIQAIVAGLDSSTGETVAHLWVVKNEEAACYDNVGFAAIGAGEWHAKSQLMFAGHTRYRPLPETLLLTFTAKKRAEVAPGVGTETDMFIVGPRPDSISRIDSDVLENLERIYYDSRRKEQRIVRNAEERMNKYVQQIAKAQEDARIAAAQEQGALPEDSGGYSPADQRQLPGGFDEGEPEGGDEEPPPS